LATDRRHESIRCWEWLSCSREGCEAHRSDDLRCWLAPNNLCFGNGFSLAERLSEKCLECPVFAANRGRAMGKRYSDRAVLDTLDALSTESVSLAGSFRDLENHAKGKSRQVELLSEVGRALQRTVEIERLLLVILTAVTAGHGLGFNRAFLMLVDSGDGTLRGRMAVGPAEAGEADGIWKAMEKEGKGLGSILSEISERGEEQNRRIMTLARRMVLPMDGINKVARSIIEGQSFIVRGAGQDPESRAIFELLGSEDFIIVPLVAEGKRLGAIVADNFVTRREITEEDRRILETFASQAALAMRNASLHSDLRRRLEELHTAHEQLRGKHIQILKAQTQVALGGLASTLFHDLRAPLVSIGLMARSAAADLGEGHAMRPRLEQIALKALEVEQHLATAGRSTRNEPAAADSVDMESVIRDSLDLLAGLMIRLGVESVVRFNAGGAVLTGSAIELRQLMLNLIQNAVEAMPGGGTVTVEAEWSGDMLRIDIKDTGRGIRTELRSKVFSAFFTTKSEGLGLGLFSAKRIVNQYGGRIEMRSEEGTGTCFTVLLPAQKQACGGGSSESR
jgi:signal transduction histidine kinase